MHSHSATPCPLYLNSTLVQLIAVFSGEKIDDILDLNSTLVQLIG